MYTVSKGPSKIVAKTRRGLSGNLDRLERKDSSRQFTETETIEAEMPKPVFHFNGKKSVHQRIQSDVITREHHEMVRFINETWLQVTCGDSETPSPTSINGSESSSPTPPPALYYQDDPPSRALTDFKPFDLETWWGNRLLQNVTSSL